MKDRNSLKSELTIALTKAAEQSFLALFSEHPESFYYCSYIMAEYGSPFICAWSKEALRRLIKSLNLKDKEQRQAEKELYKWSYADSPYVAYGVEKYFKEVQYSNIFPILITLDVLKFNKFKLINDEQ